MFVKITKIFIAIIVLLLIISLHFITIMCFTYNPSMYWFGIEEKSEIIDFLLYLIIFLQLILIGLCVAERSMH